MGTDADHFQELAATTFRIFWEKQTGCLALQHTAHTKDLFYRDGYLVAARSTIKGEALGRFLIARRLITSAEYENATLIAIREHLKLGEALVRSGALTQGILDDMLTEQVRERFFAAMGAADVTFRFTGDGAPDATVKPGHLTPVSLLRGAVARAMDMERLGRALEPWTHAPLARSGLFAEVLERADFSADERRTLVAIDGRRRIGDLLSLLASPPTPLLQTLYIAKSIGLVCPAGEKATLEVSLPIIAAAGPPGVTPSDPPARPAPPAPIAAVAPAPQGAAPPKPVAAATPAEPSDQVMTVIHAASAFQKGETALRAGRIEEALEAYQKAVKLQPGDPEYATGVAMAMYFLATSTGAMTSTLHADIEARAARALNGSPGLAKAILLRSLLAREAGRGDEEAQLFEKAVAIDPDLRSFEDFVVEAIDLASAPADGGRGRAKLFERASSLLHKLRDSGTFARGKKRPRRG